MTCEICGFEGNFEACWWDVEGEDTADGFLMSIDWGTDPLLMLTLAPSQRKAMAAAIQYSARLKEIDDPQRRWEADGLTLVADYGGVLVKAGPVSVYLSSLGLEELLSVLAPGTQPPRRSGGRGEA